MILVPIKRGMSPTCRSKLGEGTEEKERIEGVVYEKELFSDFMAVVIPGSFP